MPLHYLIISNGGFKSQWTMPNNFLHSYLNKVWTNNIVDKLLIFNIVMRKICLLKTKTVLLLERKRREATEKEVVGTQDTKFKTVVMFYSGFWRSFCFHSDWFQVYFWLSRGFYWSLLYIWCLSIHHSELRTKTQVKLWRWYPASLPSTAHSQWDSVAVKINEFCLCSCWWWSERIYPLPCKALL